MAKGPVAETDCMIRKDVWRYKPLDQSQGVNLRIRLEHRKSPKPSEPQCAIELDRQGPGKIERIEFPITKETVRAIQDGIAWFKDLPAPSDRVRTERPDVQHRCEDKSGLILMFEIPSFQDIRDTTPQYKIGDGAGFDYAFESLDALERFIRKLEGAVHVMV